MDGRIVWHDLMTPDAARARDFYGGLFGWSVKETDMPAAEGKYWVISSGSDAIGGFVPFTQHPPHWIGYVAVDDVDATVKRALAAGGTAPVPGMDVPGIGRFAVLLDPTGACIQAWRSKDGDADRPPRPGTFCWDQLLTHDPDACVAFYTKVFPWTTKTLEAGGQSYTVFACGDGREVAGVLPMPPDAGAPPHWLSYVAVEDVDAATAKVAKLGGRTWCPPTDLAGIGRFSVNADAQGAMFALFRAAHA